jgi:Mn2+/Fe2+ NRAMP family transporter
MFNGIYTFAIMVGGLVVLVPGLDLIRVMILSQTLNGILLPFLLLYMIRLINDRSVMGKHVNGPVFNTVAWGVTLTAIGLTVLLLALTVLGIG